MCELININTDHFDHFLLDMDGTLLDLKFDNDFWQVTVPTQYALSKGYELAIAKKILFQRMLDLRGSLRWYSVDFWSEETGLDIVAMKQESKHKIKIRDGAVDFLRRARLAGCRLSLLTNAHNSTIRIKFDQTGIGDFFDDVVCSHELNAPKESPEFWDRVISTIALRKEKSVFVDDSVPVLEAARTFGIGQILHVVKPDSSRDAVFHETFVNLVDFENVAFSQNS